MQVGRGDTYQTLYICICIYIYTWQGTTGGDCVDEHVGSWPLQDILSLRGFCARINHPLLPPPHLHCPHHWNTTVRILRKILPPPQPPLCVPYTIQCWRLQYLVKAKSGVVMWFNRTEAPPHYNNSLRSSSTVRFTAVHMQRAHEHTHRELIRECGD